MCVYVHVCMCNACVHVRVCVCMKGGLVHLDLKPLGNSQDLVSTDWLQSRD